MAPDDESFRTFLKANNYSSISDMEADELKKLIGFHLMYYSYNKEKLINFRPEGDQATEEEKISKAGLYYKHRTRSFDAPNWVNYSLIIEDEQEPENSYEEEFTVMVYHQERFLPVFSHLFFQTKNIDAKTNYEYFYPNSTWNGGEGFNVSNASVKEYQILADNGYIYAIDAVLEPLNTIFEELKRRSEYSTFTQLYDNNAVYEYNEGYSRTYGSTYGVDSLFLHAHSNGLPNIALEWYNPSYYSFSENTEKAYSVFAPSNQALERFYNEYWAEGGYTSVSDVEQVIMNYLLNQYVYSNSIVFPEELINGDITDIYGNVFKVDPSSIDQDSRIMCVNGTLYGIDRLEMPPLYGSVMGPAFKYKNFLNYLYVLSYSGAASTYGSPISRYIMFMPENATMEASGYFVRSYLTGNYLQYQPEGEWVTVGSSTSLDIIRTHTVQSDHTISPDKTQVLETQTTFNYLFIKDNQVTSNALFNEQLSPEYSSSPFVPIMELFDNGNSWSNGQAFSYSSENGMFTSESSSGLKYLLAATNDHRYPFYGFTELMCNANLLSGTTIPFLLTANRFVCFIPTTAAITSALANDEIPGVTGGNFSSNGTLEGQVDAEKLRSYLQNYFLTTTDNTISYYPYIGSAFPNGTYTTAAGGNLIYTATGNSISIGLPEGKTVQVDPTYDYFPFAFNDGCFHFVDSVL